MNGSSRREKTHLPESKALVRTRVNAPLKQRLSWAPFVLSAKNLSAPRSTFIARAPLRARARASAMGSRLPADLRDAVHDHRNRVE